MEGSYKAHNLQKELKAAQTIKTIKLQTVNPEKPDKKDEF